MAGLTARRAERVNNMKESITTLKELNNWIHFEDDIAQRNFSDDEIASLFKEYNSNIDLIQKLLVKMEFFHWLINENDSINDALTDTDTIENYHYIDEFID